MHVPLFSLLCKVTYISMDSNCVIHMHVLFCERNFTLFLTNLSSFISVACDNVTGSLLISFLNWMYTWNQNVIDKEKCFNSKPKIFFFSLLNKIIIMVKTYPKSYGSSNGNLISSLLKCSFKQSNASSHHSVNSFVWLIQSQTK